MSARLYAYTITPHHLDLIDGADGKLKMAQMLGIQADTPLDLDAWLLDSFPDDKFRQELTKTYGITADVIAPHADTIAKTRGYLVCIRDDGPHAAALKTPKATSGLEPLFDLPLPDKLPKPAKSDARIGGMVATYALIAMLAFMGLLIWITS